MYVRMSGLFSLALETDEVVISMPKQLEVAGPLDLSWKLNCIVWAHVAQQDRKKAFAKADSNVLREFSLNVSVTTNSTSQLCNY